MPNISKTAQVLKYFVQQYHARTKKGIQRTRLVKMAYMSDLLAREYLGEPITGFNYKRYKHGPYDDAILAAIKELELAGLAESTIDWSDEGEVESKRLISRGGPIVFDFSPAQLDVLQYVTRSYLTMRLNELLYDVVYQTTPMLEQPTFNELLPMSVVDNRGTKEVGFDLADVLAAEAAIAAKQFSPDFR